MKKCKKCGRPLGKNQYCSVCDRDKLRAAKQKQQENKSRIPWIIGIIAAVCVVVAAVVATIVAVKGNSSATAPESVALPESTVALTGELHHCQIEIENYGTITLELDASAAPITVANFLKLANEGFYNGLTFHRIMKGFMMQGGDPEGTGFGGSSETIKGEFSANGVDNPLRHTRGAISMARNSISMDSASSQFFIVHQDATASLDGQYACFGYVTDGMDVVDAICESAQPIDNNGTIPAEQQPVITAIRVID
ncbi:MAG: peptidylprolyl isomerase [Oscillospiraceae bacterium]|nr:peptidylprolyl isomerase [Oscillospiraceae bacterium]